MGVAKGRAGKGGLAAVPKHRPRRVRSPRGAGAEVVRRVGGRGSASNASLGTVAGLAGAARAQAAKLVEELGGRVDAVLERFDDQSQQAVIVVTKRLIVPLPVD